MRDHFERMLEPTDRLTLAARIVTALWLSVLLIECAVWLVISIIGGPTSPWWLWTAAIGGIVVGGLHAVARTGRRNRS
jgi:hypothetical protein